MNETTPKISVIVPVYKAEAYLHRCVDSILAQTFQDFEVLLIDDGSPDRSGEICDEYARKDRRVRVFHKENGGVSSARNVGLDNTVGEYICFVDPDDWLDGNCFEHCIRLAERHHLDILQFSYKMISSIDGNVLSVRDYECNPINWETFVKADHFMVCVGGQFIRSTIVRRWYLRFDENLHLAEDQLFMMKTMSKSGKIAQTKCVYYNYYQNPNSATHNSREEDILRSSRALLDFGERNPIFKPQIDRMISTFYVTLLASHQNAGMMKSIYKEARIKIKNLNFIALKLLRIVSYLNLEIAGKTVLVYLRLRKLS